MHLQPLQARSRSPSHKHPASPAPSEFRQIVYSFACGNQIAAGLAQFGMTPSPDWPPSTSGCPTAYPQRKYIDAGGRTPADLPFQSALTFPHERHFSPIKQVHQHQPTHSPMQTTGHTSANFDHTAGVLPFLPNSTFLPGSQELQFPYEWRPL